MTETMPKAIARDAAEADAFTRTRIERDRQTAIARYVRDRDVVALQATMARLDMEMSQAKERGGGEVKPEQALHYLSNPAELWNDTEPAERRAIAEATFDRIEAMRLDLMIHPSTEGGTLRLVGSLRHPAAATKRGKGVRTDGRGERHSPATTDLPITMRLAEPPQPCDLVRSA